MVDFNCFQQFMVIPSLEHFSQALMLISSSYMYFAHLYTIQSLTILLQHKRRDWQQISEAGLKASSSSWFYACLLSPTFI